MGISAVRCVSASGGGKVCDRLSSCKDGPVSGSRSATDTPFACHLHVSTLPALLQVLSLLGLWLDAWSGAWRDELTPRLRREQSAQTQIAKAQLQLLFPVGKELAKATCFFFLSSQPLTSHELLTHHVTAVVGPWPEMWYLLSALITPCLCGAGPVLGVLGHQLQPCGVGKPLVCWREGTELM